jgi:hypothetical protein
MFKRVGLLFVVVVVGVFGGVSCAFGASAWWHVSLGARPTWLKTGVDGEVVAKVYDLGDAKASGLVSPVRIVDSLPAGLRAVAIAGAVPEGNSQTSIKGCVVESTSVASCSFEGVLAPYSAIEMRVTVEVAGALSGEVNRVSVSGGEGQVCEKLGESSEGTGLFRDSACTEEIEGGDYELTSTGAIAGVQLGEPITVSSQETPFGVESYEMIDEEEGGVVDRQAGSHQFQTTFSVGLNQGPDEHLPMVAKKEEKPRVAPAQLPKDLNFRLPPGWIGNPTAFPRCSIGDFLTKNGDVDECPADTAMGIATVTVLEPTSIGTFTSVVPVFNLEPRPGEPARFGFYVPEASAGVYIDTSIGTGGDYAITGHVENITQTAGVLSSEVTFWGVPGDARHDPQRGWGCVLAARGQTSVPGVAPCSPASEQSPPAFLSLPTSCTGPSVTTLSGDSWLDPGGESQLARFERPGLVGCNRLPFAPSIQVVPDGQAASSSSGLKVDVHVPEEETLNAHGLAESDAKNITVALPVGVAVNPSGGDGLAACPENLIGFQGFENLGSLGGARTAIYTPSLPNPLAPGSNFCSNAAKVATVKIKTPLLSDPLEGAAYIATQNENPFGSLLAMYIVAQDPVSGVLIKLAGEIALNPETGQIVTTFENSPQAPFEDAELEFFGGERAPLATPAQCGSYTTTASITPWSGNAPVDSSSTFQITSGPDNSSCPGGSLPFGPSLTGGSTNINADAFSPLSTTLIREDGQQSMQSVTLHMPPGLSGVLTGIPLCPETQANEGTCSQESLIGETTVSAGVGSDPVSVKGGKVYLTAPYAGAPFGLAIVNPVKAGPFDLEHDTSNPAQQPACDCIVVRAKVEVNPVTAALTVTTDPSGAHAIPHIIDGIPVQIKKVNVLITRPNFTFNPTNCQPMAITGTLTSSENTASPVTVPFQTTNCALLAFTPTFKVYTSAKTSKTAGASLTVRLTRPAGPDSGQSNFAKAKVDLPKQLPSRLTTLQKACLAVVFEANPAACPPASIVGHAKVITPILPVPLEGPAYFVSHGNEAFPSLTMVLQGYGITIDSVGSTFIRKGITSTTLNTVPDAPFTLFELTLPEGKYSALAATTNLCKTKLTMPTAFVAQNNTQIHTTTPITTTGCPKPHTTKHTNTKHTTKHTKTTTKHHT